jgi:hypothetical protein
LKSEIIAGLAPEPPVNPCTPLPIPDASQLRPNVPPVTLTEEQQDSGVDPHVGIIPRQLEPATHFPAEQAPVAHATPSPTGGCCGIPDAEHVSFVQGLPSSFGGSLVSGTDIIPPFPSQTID